MYSQFNLRNRRFPFIRPLATLLAAALTAIPALAQLDRLDTPTGVALSGAMISVEESPWGGIANPARFPGVDSTMVAAATSQATTGPFVPGSVTLVVLPRRLSRLRLAGLFHGTVVGPYRDISVAASGAFDPGNDLSIGGTILLRAVAVDRYPSLLSVELGAGGRFHPTDRIEVAAAVSNLTGSSIADEPATTSITVEIGGKLSAEATVGLSLFHESDRGARIALGMASALHDDVTLLGGITTDPVGLSLGSSLSINGTGIDIGISYTVPLGVRTAVGVWLVP